MAHKLILTLLISLATLSLECSDHISMIDHDSDNSFDILRDQKEFKDKLIQNSLYNIIVLFDPVKCLKCFGLAARLLKSLSQLELVHDYSIGLAMINTRDFKQKLPRNRQLAAGLLFINKNEAYRFEDYLDLTEKGLPYKYYHEKLLRRTVEFLTEHILPIREMTSIDLLEEQLEKHGVLGIYFANRQAPTFAEFKKASIKSGGFPLFYCDNWELSEQIHKHYQRFSPSIIQDNFIVIRHKSKLNEIDNKQLHTLSQPKSQVHFQRFMILNKHPKIIKDIEWSDLVFEFLSNRVNAIIFVSASENTDDILAKTFVDTVTYMPKIMAYFQLNRSHPLFKHHLFEKIKSTDILFVYALGEGTKMRISVLPCASVIDSYHIPRYLHAIMHVNESLHKESFSRNIKIIETVPEDDDDEEEESQREEDDKTDDDNSQSNFDILEDQGDYRCEAMRLLPDIVHSAANILDLLIFTFLFVIW